MNENYFNHDGTLNSGLAWTLFELSGAPGYYMLYSDLAGLENDGEDISLE